MTVKGKLGHTPYNIGMCTAFNNLCGESDRNQKLRIHETASNIYWNNIKFHALSVQLTVM